MRVYKALNGRWMILHEPWPVGTEVAWFGPYDREPTGIATVEKVHKTGHIVVRGRRFRIWSENSAGETGDGYSKASVRIMTPDLAKAIERSKKKRAMKRIGEWLASADPDTIPDAAMADLASVMRAQKPNEEQST